MQGHRGSPRPQLAPKLADALTQTRLHFSGRHRDTAVCSGSWSPDALIETLRPCRNQREGTERGGHPTHLASARGSDSFHISSSLEHREETLQTDVVLYLTVISFWFSGILQFCLKVISVREG